MLLAIPIIQERCESGFWQRPEARELASALVDRLRRCLPGARLHVVTDCTDGEGLAQELGLPAALVRPARDGESALPQDMETARRWLCKAAPGQELGAVSPLHPLLGAACLEAALGQLHQPQAPCVLSVSRPDDHPCQFVHFRRIEHLDGLLFFDPAPPAELREAHPSHAVTREFPFHWDLEGCAVFEQGALALPVPAMDRLELRRIRELAPGNPEHCLAFVRTGPATARALVQLEHLGLDARALAGATLPFAGCEDLLLARRNESGLRLDLSRVGFPPSDAVVNMTMLEACAPCQPAREVTAAKASGWRLPDPAPECFGVLCSMERPVCTGGFEVMDHFSPRPGLWHYDPHSRLQINDATGEPIHGRQAFPEVWRVEGAFFFAPDVAALPSLAGLQAEAVAGQPMSRQEAFCVSGWFDVFQLQCLQEQGAVEVEARIQADTPCMPPTWQPGCPAPADAAAAAEAVAGAAQEPPALPLQTARLRFCSHLLTGGSTAPADSEQTPGVLSRLYGAQARVRQDLALQARAGLDALAPGESAPPRVMDMLEAMLQLGPAPYLFAPTSPDAALLSRAQDAMPPQLPQHRVNLQACLLLHALQQGADELALLRFNALARHGAKHDMGRLRILLPTLQSLLASHSSTRARELADRLGEEHVLRHLSWPQVFLGLVNAILGGGNYAVAARLMGCAAHLPPGDPVQMQLQADLSIRTGHPARGLELLERLERTSFEFKQIGMLKAYAHRSLWQLEEALEQVERDIRHSGETAGNQVFRIELLRDMGLLEELEKAAERCLQSMGDLAPNQQGMVMHFSGLAFRTLGDAERATALLRQSRKLRSQMWQEHFQLALTLEDTGQLEEALRVALEGHDSNLFPNNCCPALATLLQSGMQGFSPAAARDVVKLGAEFVPPWMTLLPAWAGALGTASLAVTSGAEAAGMALERIMNQPAILHPRAHARLRILVQEGRSPLCEAAAEAYAKGAFPNLPPTSFEHRVLKNLFLRAQESEAYPGNSAYPFLRTFQKVHLFGRKPEKQTELKE